jgi:hypothetical protein
MRHTCGYQMITPILEEACEQLSDQIRINLLTDLLIRKLGKHGIRVSAKERPRLRKWISNGATGSIPVTAAKREKKEIAVDFTPRDVRRLKWRMGNKLPDVIAECVTTTIKRSARPVLRIMKEDWLKQVQRNDRLLHPFLRRLARTWRRPMELLKVQLHLARSVGNELNDELRRHPGQNAPVLVEAITMLHARACQISAEVLVLLEAGFAEGAMARWRSLHEVATTLLFIQKHGSATAERYLAHDVVESWKAAKEYSTHSARLGYEPISTEELAEVKRAYDSALMKYGDGFGTSYGWAASDLQIRKPTFADIEKGAGFEHFRPFYRLASHPVHANSKAVKFRLGMLEGTNALPVGPTNYGLADPGQNTGLSLSHVTAALITMAPTYERLLHMQIMAELARELGNAFAQVQVRIEDRDQHLRKGPKTENGRGLND